MRDPALARCWTDSAELIGWNGDDRAVEGLYEHLRSFRFPDEISLAHLHKQIDYVARMALGLAIAASHRHGTELGDRLVKFIIERTYARYWQARLPKGRAQKEAPKFGVDWSLFDKFGASSTVGPLSATGSEAALLRLYAYREEGRSDRSI